MPPSLRGDMVGEALGRVDIVGRHSNVEELCHLGNQPTALLLLVAAWHWQYSP